MTDLQVLVLLAACIAFFAGYLVLCDRVGR